MRRFEQRWSTHPGVVIGRFYYRSGDPYESAPTGHRELWGEDYARMQIGDRVKFTGQTYLIRVQ